MEAIEQLFQTSLQSNGNGPKDWGVGNYFTQLINSNPNTIPTLSRKNINALPPGSLVRYRGMIQDSFDPEYFQAISTCTNTTTGERRFLCSKYRDVIPTAPDGFQLEQNPLSASSTMSRQPLFCVPIPGENEWARLDHSKTTPPPPCDIQKKKKIRNKHEKEKKLKRTN